VIRAEAMSSSLPELSVSASTPQAHTVQKTIERFFISLFDPDQKVPGGYIFALRRRVHILAAHRRRY
jgi:hypothetical protein